MLPAPPASPRTPRVGRCRGSRKPLEKTLAPLTPPYSEAGKDQSRGEGPGGRTGDNTGKGSRDTVLGTDLSIDPWVVWGGLPNLCSAHLSGQKNAQPFSLLGSPFRESHLFHQLPLIVTQPRGPHPYPV